MMKTVNSEPAEGIRPNDSTGIAIRSRIASTRILAALLLLLFLVSGNRWDDSGLFDSILELSGFILVCISAFGRSWALLYISGYKNEKLITDGPYSVVRNPLYLFNLLGGVGLGLSAESLLIAGALVLAFALYYPAIMLAEEKKLLSRHRQDYVEYYEKTPKFIPKYSLFREPETYVINVKNYRKGFLDATVFLWIYALLQVVEKMHHLGLLPTLFKIP